jgi:uncharacterized protein
MHKFAFLFLMLPLIAAGPKRPDIVTIAPAPEVQMKPGGAAQYLLSFKVQNGYHVQANPASEEYLIPTTVSLEKADGIVPQTPIYPKPVSFKLQGSDKEIKTYENENTITIPLQADESTIPGEKILKGTIRYQGCDSTTCFPPKTIPFEAKIIVTK